MGRKYWTILNENINILYIENESLSFELNSVFSLVSFISSVDGLCVCVDLFNVCDCSLVYRVIEIHLQVDVLDLF